MRGTEIHDHGSSLLDSIHQVNRNLDTDFCNDRIWKLEIQINTDGSYLGIRKTYCI